MIAWSPVFLLGAFTALTYWLNAQVQSGTGRSTAPAATIPTFISRISRPRASTLKGGSGNRSPPGLRVTFPDDDTTEFESPLITFSDPGKPPVTISADRGVITGDQKDAYFTGNVKGIRAASAEDREKGPVIVTSEYLHVLPKEDRIETDKPVTISDPRGIINGTGMEFDNKAKTFKFKSRVSGQLQPNK